MQHRVLIALLVLGGAPALRASSPPDAYPGAIRSWVWQIDPDLLPFATEAYVDLLAAIPADARILVAVENDEVRRRFERLMRLDASADHRVVFARTGTGLTGWARDRYLLVRRASGTAALLPGEAETPADRRGDLSVPRALAGPCALSVTQTGLALEGGNVIVGTRDVFIGRGIELANPPARLRQFAAWIDRHPVTIGALHTPAPHEHIDMFMALVDEDTVVLGDPLMLVDLIERPAVQVRLARLGPFSVVTQHLHADSYEAVATQLRARGYRVVRVPALHADDGNTVVTWTNAVVERRRGVAHVYLPSYGLGAFDQLARAIWEKAGCRVHPIRSDTLIGQGGAVRCLTNVVRD